MKRLTSMILVVVVMLSMSVGVYAAIPETVLPMWTNISSMNNSFTFDGTTGISSCTAVGKAGTTKIVGSITIYQQIDGEWVYVDSTSGSSTSIVLVLSIEFEGEPDEYYMSVFDVTVTRNGVDETESKPAYSYC